MRPLAIAFLITLAPLAAAPITQQERDALLSHLERTRALFLKSVSTISPAQWTFKESPERWSIAECAEHIVTTEGALLGLVRDQMMKQPAPAEKPVKRATDEGVLKLLTDRNQKAKAPEILQPKARYPGRAESIAAFEKARAVSAEYVRTTGDDLRGRFGNSPGGAMDGYQYLLMMAAHTERHTMQIEEVKAAAGYPK